MGDFKASRIVRRYTHELDAAPAEVFPLLCPTREYEWIDTWACEIVHSISGYAELDCVFTTGLLGQGKQTWLVCAYEPPQRIAFVVSGSGRVLRYTVSVEPIGGARSKIEWTQVLTGLDEEGHAFLAALTPENYERTMRGLSLALNHFLVEGKVLPMAQALESRS
jgi:hypothetical protein